MNERVDYNASAHEPIDVMGETRKPLIEIAKHLGYGMLSAISFGAIKLSRLHADWGNRNQVSDPRIDEHI
jgi:hypothetical protein